MKKRCLITAVCVVLLMSVAVSVGIGRLPDEVFVSCDSPFSYLNGLVTVIPRSETIKSVSGGTEGLPTLALFGIVPLKTVRVTEMERVKLTVCGTPFGVKLLTDGVVVVGFGNVYGGGIGRCPAKDAGIRLGDVILTVGERRVRGNRDLAAIIGGGDGGALEVVVVRDGQQLTLSLEPALGADGGWKAGLWVRDSTAGIGMLTYYDRENNIAAGLGHAVSDADVGVVMPLLSGEFAGITITGVRRGVSGSAGELKGSFSSNNFADVIHNGPTGIFGEVSKAPECDKELPIAFKHEVRRGNAYIVTTVDGGNPQKYSAFIERVFLNDKSETRNLIIRITDSRLVEKTGGIVAGMSGSPIIQNGRLVGAVTHVFINEPTKGYGIFIENMLKTQYAADGDNVNKAA